MQFQFIVWCVSVRIDHISIYSGEAKAIPSYDQGLEFKDRVWLRIKCLKHWDLDIFPGALKKTNFSSYKSSCRVLALDHLAIHEFYHLFRTSLNFQNSNIGCIYAGVQNFKNYTTAPIIIYHAVSKEIVFCFLLNVHFISYLLLGNILNPKLIA